jgi:hypothetical protein
LTKLEELTAENRRLRTIAEAARAFTSYVYRPEADVPQHIIALRTSSTVKRLRENLIKALEAEYGADRGAVTSVNEENGK